jgi:hypothetical protein
MKRSNHIAIAIIQNLDAFAIQLKASGEGFRPRFLYSSLC